MGKNSKKSKKSVVAGETTEIPVITEEQINENKETNNDDANNVENIENVENEKIDEKIEEKSEEKVEEVKEQENTEIEKEEKKEEVKNQVMVPKKEHKKLSKGTIAIIIVVSILLLLVIAFGILVCVNKVNNNVYKNVYLEETNLGGYAVKDVETLIDEQNAKYDEEILIDIYQDAEKLKTISSQDIEFRIDKENTVKDIVTFGREGNIFKDNFNIIKALFNKKVVDKKYQYDSEKLDEVLKNIEVELKGRFVEDKYNVDEKQQKLIIKRGKKGNSLDYEQTKEDIISLFVSGENTELNLQIISKTPENINAQEIYDNVKREPEDASIDRTKKPVETKNEVYGIDLDVKSLQAILDKDENKKEDKEIEFDLTFVEPKVKLRDIAQDLCLEKIAGLTTYFDASQYARANNLRVALEYLNDVIIMPGEIFSYNAIIGDTTAAKGYMAAAIFKGGRVENEMGGGICQTSSTLYNVALLADLEIVERHAHGLPVGYVRPSLDATVYGDILDFRFRNTRSYPLKIVTSFSSGGEMNISLYGTKEEVEYDIELVSNYLYTVNYRTEYIQDPNMEEGTQEVVYNGVNGYASEAYFIKSLNGQVVENRFLSRDVYSDQINTIRVGTKVSEVTE